MLIYYFTRTSRSKQVAETLAQRNGTTARPIGDGKHWTGAFGFLKALFATLTDKSIPAIYDLPGEEEQIVVVFPVWASNLPPAVKTFAQEVGRQRITAVPTSLNSPLTDRQGFYKVIDLVGKEFCIPQEL